MQSRQFADRSTALVRLGVSEVGGRGVEPDHGSVQVCTARISAPAVRHSGVADLAPSLAPKGLARRIGDRMERCTTLQPDGAERVPAGATLAERWPARQGRGPASCPAVQSSPCLDLVAQPKNDLSLLDTRHREVAVAPPIDAYALRIAEANDLRDLLVVHEVVRVDALIGIGWHAEIVVDKSNSWATVEPHNTGGPGGAVTPRGPAKTEVPVMTVLDFTRPRSGGAR